MTSAKAIGKFLGRHFDFILGLIGIAMISIPIGILYILWHFVHKYW